MVRGDTNREAPGDCCISAVVSVICPDKVTEAGEGMKPCKEEGDEEDVVTGKGREEGGGE